MTQTPQPFNPREHLRQIKSKEGMQDYLDVKWRLVWFREQCPGGTIDTEELEYDLDREVEAEGYQWNNDTRRSEKIVKRAHGYARYRAVVTDGKGGRATGTKSENAANFADFGEKAETGAIGRALAALGFGTQFTGDELNEDHRIVDAPVVRKSEITTDQDGMLPPDGNGKSQTVSDGLNAAPPSEQQLASIQKLRMHLGLSIAELPQTYAAAKELIAQLSKQYNERKRAS